MQDNEYIATPIQIGLYYAHFTHPSTSTYNIPICFEANHQIDMTKLQYVIDQLTLNHKMLRTTFHEQEATIIQRIHPSHHNEINFIECQDSQIHELLETLSFTSFDLSQLPLWRIYRVKSDSHQLVLFVFHHMIIDEWSMNLLLKAVFDLYHNQDTRNDIIEPPLHYINFSENLLKWQQTKQYQQKYQYWANRLKQAPYNTTFPADTYKQQHLYDNQVGTHKFTLNHTDLSGLNEFTTKYKCTIFELFFAAFHLLLYKYNQQTSNIIGIASANRDYKGAKHIIGCFTNLLPILMVNNNNSFCDYLNELKNSVREAYDNQVVSFHEIQGAVKSAAHESIIQTLFVWQVHDESVSSQQDFKPYVLSQKFARYSLSLYVTASTNYFKIKFDYDKTKYSEYFIKNVANYYKQLIYTCINTPEKLIDDIELSESQSGNVITGKYTPNYIKDNQCLYMLFLSKAALLPNHIAIKDDTETYTYQQMMQLSTQLAIYLSQQSYEIGDVIALHFTPSPLWVITVLAIHMTGLVVLPLNIDDSQEVNNKKITIAQAKLIISDQSNSITCEKQLFDQTTIELLIDNATKIAYREHHLIPSELAYILFTSGSTGEPKAVKCTHIGYYNRLLWMRDYFDINQHDKFIFKTSCFFDVSIWEYYLPLISGACVYIPEQHIKYSPKKLQQTINDQEITVLHFIPSLIDVYAKHITPQSNSIRYVFTSGEALQAYQLKSIYQYFASAQCVNLYGPTEASIDVTYYSCSRTDTESPTIPIGKPIDNVQLYIFNKNKRAVPKGAIGILHISGKSLAGGYISTTNQAADKFIDNPYVQGDILYRTGDLVSLDTNGNIIFHGREDRQVKLRGMRIDLAEVEYYLLTYPIIEQAHVMLAANNVLMAYIGCQKNAANIEQIHSYLATKIPRYMLPARYQFVEAFPRLANGKIDHNQLTKISGGTTDRLSEKPRNLIERVLCHIWQEQLQLEEVSIHDEYFQIGGNSLIALDMIAKAKQHGISITVETLLNYPILKDLAVHAIDHIKVTDLQVQQNVLLSTNQAFYFQANMPNEHYFNFSKVLFTNKPITQVQLEKYITYMLIRHPALRTQFIKDSTQLVHLPNDFSTENIEPSKYYNFSQDNRDIEEVFTDQYQIALHAKLNINTVPLIYFDVINHKSNTHQYITIVVHHLVFDIYSWQILLNEFDRFLDDQVINDTNSVDSYAAWSVDHAHQSNQSQYKKLIQYQTFPICQDNTRELKSTISLELSVDIKHLLNSLSSPTQSINELLIASILLAHYRVFHNNHMSVLSEHHGRSFSDLDLSQTIGWLTEFRILEIDNLASLDKQPIEAIMKCIKAINTASNNIIRLDDYPSDTLPQICLNYWGRKNKPSNYRHLEVITNKSSNNIDLQNNRLFEIDILAYIDNNILTVNLLFNDSRISSELIKQFFEHIKTNIVTANSECSKKFALNEYYEIPHLKRVKQAMLDTIIIFCYPLNGELVAYNKLLHNIDECNCYYLIPFDPSSISLTQWQVDYLAKQHFELMRQIDFNQTTQVIFIGWSFGGYIAFEMTKLFEATYSIPAKLLVIDQPFNLKYINIYDIAKNQLGIIKQLFDLDFSINSVLNNLSRDINIQISHLQTLCDNYNISYLYDKLSIILLNLYSLSKYTISGQVEQMIAIYTQELIAHIHAATDAQEDDMALLAYRHFTKKLLKCDCLPGNHYTVLEAVANQIKLYINEELQEVIL